jgi:signal peptide peptidase SppA
MLNRLRSYFSSAATSSIKGRRRGARGSPNAAPPASSAQGSTAGAPKPGFDASKLFTVRNGLLLVGGGALLFRTLTDTSNPNSIINQTLYPKGRGKYALKIEKMDDKVANYEVSYATAIDGVRAAFNVQKRHHLSRQLGAKLGLFSAAQADELIRASKVFTTALDKMNAELNKLRDKQIALLKTSVKKSFDSKKVVMKPSTDEKIGDKQAQDAKDEAPKVVNEYTLDNMVESEEGVELRNKILELLSKKLQLEMAFMMTVEAVLMSEDKTHNILHEDPTVLARIKNALLGLETGKYEAIMERLSKISLLPAVEKPKIFVLTFRGDVMASQLFRLREEITALEAIAKKERGDRVVIKLHSGGGTVTGYGLAANELKRIKDLGLPLDICVDEVAASGGYMMASVADRIIAAPFAVVGSVGVIATIPNFAERLQREGVAVEDITAGKYKRTLTPYKKTNEEDRRKMKEDVEVILRHFKSFLKSNRPKLDVDKVATGETWSGEDAVKLGLVDQLRTSEKHVLQLRDELNADVLFMSVRRVKPAFSDALEDDQHSDANAGWTGMMQAWVAKILIGALRMVVRENTSDLMGYGVRDDEEERWLHDRPRIQSPYVDRNYMLGRVVDTYERR